MEWLNCYADMEDWLMSANRLLDRGVVHLCPYEVPNPLIAVVYDPFHKVILSSQLISTLDAYGFMDEMNFVNYGKDLELFEHAEVATKIMRLMFTNNFYVFTWENRETEAIGILDDDEDEVNEFLQICEKFNLCGVVFRPNYKHGYKIVNLSEENSTNPIPNHLNVINYPSFNFTTFPKFKNYYYKMYRYELFAQQTNYLNGLDDIEFLKRFSRWCWIPFMLPLSAKPNSINTNLLLKHLWNNLDEICHVDTSLKLILNCLNMHPLQISGVSTTIACAQKYVGNEICFRNFLFIHDASIIQWLKNYSNNWKAELYKSWCRENDWKLKSEIQQTLMKIFIYANENDLKTYHFPNHLRTLWERSLNNIEHRIFYDISLEKLRYVENMLKMLKWTD